MIKQLSLVVLALSLSACMQKPLNPNSEQALRYRVDETFVLTPNQHAEINLPEKGHKLVIVFNSVSSDSRCPINARCIQMGKATLELQILNNTNSSTLTLNTDDQNSAQIADHYTLNLLELLPKPLAGSATTMPEYRAQFVVEKFTPPSTIPVARPPQ